MRKEFENLHDKAELQKALDILLLAGQKLSDPKFKLKMPHPDGASKPILLDAEDIKSLTVRLTSRFENPEEVEKSQVIDARYAINDSMIQILPPETGLTVKKGWVATWLQRLKSAIERFKNWVRRG